MLIGWKGKPIKMNRFEITQKKIKIKFEHMEHFPAIHG